MKHMVYPVIFSCFLICSEISCILHYHNRPVIPLFAAADRTQLLICQRKAFPAVPNIGFCLGNGAGQAGYLFLWHIDNMKSQPLG